MIVSETPNRVNSRALQACILLCAAVVLPVGMTFAQDHDAVEKRLGEAIAEGEISIEQARVMMDALRRSATELKERGEGLVGHYKRMGVSVETLGKYKKVLAEAGVKDKQMEGTLGGMTRVVYEMKSEGDDYELDPGLGKYFKDELGLSGKQIELVEGVARRILHRMKESDRER